MTAVDVAQFASTAVAPPLPAPEPWRDPGIWAADKLTGGEVNTTTRMTLFDALQGPGRRDFIPVDIEGGKRWLASRLFIFAILLKEIRGLRFVVIVESAAGLKKKLLGITTPDEVRSALAASCPWFDKQLREAANAAGVSVFRSRMSLGQARTVLDNFLDGLQVLSPPGDNDLEWSEIEERRLWERSPWLTSDRVTSDLTSTFYDFDESTIQRTSVQADFNLYVEVMRRREPCVASVNARGEFLDLFPKQPIIDRFLDQVNNSFGATPSGPPIHVHTERGDIVMGASGGITISGGTVGAATTGGTAIIGSINQAINGLLDKDETKDVGAALKALSAAIESEESISDDKKKDFLELLDEITRKAAEPKENMKKSVIKSVIDSFSGLCAGVDKVATAWQTWGSAVTGFFGL